MDDLTPISDPALFPGQAAADSAQSAPLAAAGGLEVISIAKSYDKRAVLSDISLSVAKGEAASDAAAPDFSAGDFKATFARGSAASLAAFKAAGAMDKTMIVPWGEMKGSEFLGLAAVDTFAHAWDLARATGQSTDLNPELAAGLLVGSRAGISHAFRGPEGAPFGPEQKAPAGASKADELAAFLGRTV